MQPLRADTATEVTIGPAVAVGDGFTPVTGLVGTSADEFEIIKHGATATTTIAGTLAAITGADGYYALDLSATDSNTEGRLTLLINDDSLILPIRQEFIVYNANVFDALFGVAGLDLLNVQVAGMDANVLTAAAINAAAFTAAKFAAVGEPAQGAPPLSADPMTKIAWMYKAFRNRKTVTNSQMNLFNDDAVTIDTKWLHSDDDTTYDQNEAITGP